MTKSGSVERFPAGVYHQRHGSISLKVVSGRSRDEVVGWLGDSLKVKVKAPPEKGRANEAVVVLLAERLGIDPSSIAVVSGHGSPAKIVAVEGMDDAAIRQAFPAKKPGKSQGMRNGDEASYPLPKTVRPKRYPTVLRVAVL